MEEAEERRASALSAAQRARAERNRLRARALKEARLAARPAAAAAAAPAADTGGGFLPAAEAAPAPRAAPPPAPVLDPAERPACLDCGRSFAHSYLFDTFGHRACDECRDEDGEHALVARTEAKAEFLLTDADLDLRPPALSSVRRRNPHAPRGDMRLYLLAQLRERALLVWGSEEALQAERAAREERRAASRCRRAARSLRALRMDVRSSLFRGTSAPHRHRWGPEAHRPDSDTYERACCDCGHTETYEKM